MEDKGVAPLYPQVVDAIIFGVEAVIRCLCTGGCLVLDYSAINNCIESMFSLSLSLFLVTGERCLDNDTNMMLALELNPHALWIIKPRNCPDL